MITRDLPANATLESIRKQAKAFLKALKAGDAAARQRALPYFNEPAAIGLQDAQLVIAREFGLSSWKRLKTHLERGQPGKPATEQLANRFLSLATVSYFADIAADPERYAQAKALIDEHPEIAGENIHVAAALGDSEAIDRWLDTDPKLSGKRGGPYNWEPLLYAAYARVPDRSSLAAGERLIARGADANAFWMDDGQYRFTALTGVFGHGEAGRERQPEHPDCIAFAELLLRAGAKANDSQALYNRMFEPDNTCIGLLLQHGLSAKDRNNWPLREDSQLIENREGVFDYQLAWALEKKMADRVRLLVQHGADVNRAVKGRTPYQWAELGGDASLAAYLVAHGATVTELTDVDRLAQSIDEGNATEAKALAAADATLVSRTQAAHPAILHEAAGENRPALVALMLSLGFDVNRMTSRTPLHEAALHGHIEMAKLLLEHGANAMARDPYHHAAPIGWAEYNGKADMVRFLENQSLDLFAAAAFGNGKRVLEIVDEKPELLDIPFGQFRAHGRPNPQSDWMTPLAIAVVNRRPSVVKLLLENGANANLRDGTGTRSIRDLARDGGNDEIISLLRRAPSFD
ncbi:ankyrin repeat domain-containing protein [Sinorhizobium meliloti]|uniref:ankyrin repeat domain-containing protein n=1 Tax=Rhizobium meliloti TaxID=382 RepID=UPI0002861305|nr:ankyrin repeat domain-containing protein [Sinorhizobium meliloti]ASP77212.1 ankyrin repeat domain-containing protein [Sinorhizobium meliloti]KKA15089.1 ankyrin [Sinorhizobium meliloti]MQW16952.1 ankyrin repeat domain-containing protein [Sinorhizobium meliloti]QGJ74428.1 ankyrin repeat domain-containing protein [Sinorhizobium meliloti]QND26942.1 ankyrin repeat domain-containing protein [Sinorhizobium meliloti]